MVRKISLLNRLIRDVSGATAIEYGLIAALISAALIVVLGLVGVDIAGLFTAAANAIGNVVV